MAQLQLRDGSQGPGGQRTCRSHDARALALAAAATAAPLFVSRSWAFDSIVNVSLWDKTDADMVTGLGWGMSGDMSTATMGITAKPDAVKAGKVTFEATNNSENAIHEVILVPMPKDGALLPYEKDNMRVDEDAAHSLGEVSELDPGASGALTVTLMPGTFLLICNVPGHYEFGMWTAAQVEP